MPSNEVSAANFCTREERGNYINNRKQFKFLWINSKNSMCFTAESLNSKIDIFL